MSIVNMNGATVLFFANFLGKIFGAIYRIPLAQFIGVEGMGLYQMAFPIYSFLLTMITGGINVVLTRRIAASRANGDLDKINKDFVCAKRISVFLGIVVFILLLVLAVPLSKIQGNFNAIYGYLGISIGVVFACVLGAYRGYFQGFGNMVPTAISQLMEQIIKLVAGLFLASALVKYGIVYGVLGAVLGVSISEIFCFICFAVYTKKQKIKKQYIAKREYLDFFKDCTSVGMTYGIMPFSALIDSFLVVNLLSISGFVSTYATSLYGLETGMILPLINMPNILISAIAIASIPELSYKKQSGENCNSSISKIFKTAYMFILPCCFGLFLLAEPIISLVYPSLDYQMLNIAVNLLKLSVFQMFFMCFITISNAVLQAIGRFKTPIYSLTAGLVVKTFLTVLLVANNSINIVGLVIASVIGYFIVSTINLLVLKKDIGFSLKGLDIIIPFFACTLMVGIISLYFRYIQIYSFIRIVALIAVSAITYFIILLIFKRLSIKELKNLLQNTHK